MACAYKIEFIDKKLIYSLYDKIKKETIPTNEEWEAFWNILDEIGFWNWKRLYEFDPATAPEGAVEITCIPVTNIKISYKNRIQKTCCSSGEPETMNDFFDALEKLAGGDITGGDRKELYGD